MKLSLYYRPYESNIPYAIIFNDRLTNCVDIGIVAAHVANALRVNGYGTKVSFDSIPLSFLKLVDHYEFDEVHQLEPLLRNRNPELFI